MAQEGGEETSAAFLLRKRALLIHGTASALRRLCESDCVFKDSANNCSSIKAPFNRGRLEEGESAQSVIQALLAAVSCYRTLAFRAEIVFPHSKDGQETGPQMAAVPLKITPVM